jgi:hypothetical protein
MNLPDLKQLDKVIALCRKRGVKSIKIDNVELTLSEDAPAKQTRKKSNTKEAEQVSATVDTAFESDSPTEDELLFWSSVQVPESEMKN